MLTTDKAKAYIKNSETIKNEVGCRDDTMPKAVDTRKHHR